MASTDDKGAYGTRHTMEQSMRDAGQGLFAPPRGDRASRPKAKRTTTARKPVAKKAAKRKSK